MLLNEIANDRRALINATLEHIGASNRLRVSDEALDEAIRLMDWAYKQVNVEDFQTGLAALYAGRSIMSIRSSMRVMGPSGFPEHPRMRMLEKAARDNDITEVRLHRADAISFARDVRDAFINLCNLTEIAIGNPHFGLKPEPPDALDIAVVKAMFKKLGLEPKDIIF